MAKKALVRARGRSSRVSSPGRATNAGGTLRGFPQTPSQRIETQLIHAGQEPDPATGGVAVPINLSTTFAQTAPNEHMGFDYSRAGNPTRQALETAMATLERGASAF